MERWTSAASGSVELDEATGAWFTLRELEEATVDEERRTSRRPDRSRLRRLDRSRLRSRWRGEALG
jgi:hypothetical protein